VIVAVAAAGWVVTIVLALALAVLRRRLELVACAAHELRGPAAALDLLLASLRRNAAGLRQERALAAQLDRLRVGLADLEAAREGRRAAPRIGPVALDRLAHGAAAGWRPGAVAAGRRLAVAWEGRPAVIRADRRRLMQALGNLVENAVEHGTGPVELTGRRERDRVVLEVWDGGRPGERPAPVEAVDGSGRRDRGRGLEIAARAARDAGGQLHLDCGPGGTRATLELPLGDG